MNTFTQIGVPTDVSAAVYYHLSTLPWMQPFPVEPSDNLRTVYGIEGEELFDVYTSILAELGRSMPDSRKNDALTVDTVEELVKFIADLATR